ncbi:Zinc finger CCCH domain-containing protein 55 [Forsythia ovata]|uniref:Zinc finger CCCH domain-containing protein 55 n=1 Tax=Forsythia ovata TaxID=205694 RepID=A0ABD1QQC2_9LAMI
MDAYEATKIVFQRIQSLDPENASKIMGILLLQDHGEKEMIRLAFGPESQVHSVILKARKDLGLASSNTPSTPSSPSPSPFSNSLSLSRTNSSSSASSRLLGGVNFPSPLSMPNQSSTAASSWANSSFSDFQTPDDLISPGSAPVAYNATSPSAMNSAALPFYGEVDLIDELHLQDQLAFLNDGSPSLMPKSPDMFYPQQDLASSPSGNGGGEGMLFPSYGGASENWGDDSVNGLPHRRSCSASDICLGPDDLGGGLGWKPCLYFARGYCKNGTSCRFVHGENGADGAAMVGSPSKFEMMEQCQELLRSKSVQQQQRLAAATQLMASTNFPYSPVATNRCMNFLLQQQLQAESPRALIMGDDMHKFSRSRLERGDFGMMNPGSRQIYLTFPADSTFKEEDVSNYFSIYGPVQDVRIPYQQKRMFGFVTFLYPETVKLILAKGNPHFVCDARVLVKPYKEKGKIPDRHRKQPQMERGEYTGCNSPTGLETRDSYDLQLGTRTFYNNPDMLWRRKLEEQADLQQAIELQNRRLMGLQLLDIKRNSHHRTLSTGGIISSPTQSPGFFNQNVVLSCDRSSPESKEENVSILGVTNPANVTALEAKQTVNVTDIEKQPSSLKVENGKDKGNSNKENDFQESLEHNLPDSPFASPKAAVDYTTAFSEDTGEADKTWLHSNHVTSKCLDLLLVMRPLECRLRILSCFLASLVEDED